jgi:hypothetical protein
MHIFSLPIGKLVSAPSAVNNPDARRIRDVVEHGEIAVFRRRRAGSTVPEVDAYAAVPLKIR